MRDALTDLQMKQAATRLATEIAVMPSPANVADRLAAIAAGSEYERGDAASADG